MKYSNIIKWIILFIIIYAIYITIFKGYHEILPSFPIYPRNKKEFVDVKKMMEKRTRDDEAFFHLTNDSIAAAFVPYVKENKKELEKIATSHNFIIITFKTIINRRRPWQIDPTLKPINIKTAQTPAYPAGHAYQAYLLCKYLVKKYPNKKDILEKVALRCDDCRIKAGLHYPSDGKFSRQLVDLFYK
tara:strand:+ start:3289 stop:3852 length:564 start_codon:yes stop_codon:yes gene_type:complete